MTENEFVDLVCREFPDIAEEVRDQDDLLYMQVGVFATRVQQMVDEGDRPALKRAVHLAQRTRNEGDANLRNAISVAFLEHLTFNGATGERALAMLTSDLRQEWQKLQSFMASMDKHPGNPAKAPPKRTRSRRR